MYNQKLVAAIKSNGKILREFGESVYVPFGTEYSILLKNLHDRRVVARVYIDGVDVTAGGLVIGARKEIDFERSLANGSMDKGNKFKFIERSGSVEEHRGIKLEDGLVRVEYEFEHVYPKVTSFTTTHTTGPWYDNNPLRGVTHFGTACGSATSVAGGSTMNYSVDSIPRSATKSKSKGKARSVNSNEEVYTASVQCSAPANETGVTVNGSKSEQKFTMADWFPTESETHTIVLNLFGETEDNKVIREPITTKTKQECTSCGRKEKASASFCSKCGTALEVFA